MTPFASPARSTPPRAMRRAAARGFTLVELMVTVAIAAILMSVAAPSLTSMIRGNRVQTEASQLVGDLQFARTEAVKRGLPVSVCPSSDSKTCLGSNVWNGGWLVFVDVGANGSIGNGDTLLRVGKALRSGDTAAAAPALTFVTFNRDGFTTGLGASTVLFQIHTSDNVARMTRCVSVDLGGRLSTLTALAPNNTSMGATCR